jgi:hypothetical protein
MTDWSDEETRKPGGTPLWAKLFVIGVLAVGAWIALSFVFALVGRAVALVGYIVVAVLAYYVGKAVGRASAGPDG